MEQGNQGPDDAATALQSTADENRNKPVIEWERIAHIDHRFADE
jgi:hypothetical protein